MTVDFIIVGAQKCGTTSLHRYMSTHPSIWMPEQKEIGFFYYDNLYSQGPERYSMFFGAAPVESVVGEASPQYMYDELCAQRISKHLPQVKLIFCLRNPLDRALSHYKMNYRRGLEKRSFNQVVSDWAQGIRSMDPELRYIELGEYGRLVGHFLKFYPLDDVLIINSRNLKFNKRSTMEKVCSFLGLNFEIDLNTLEKNFHQAGDFKYPWINRLVRRSTSLPGFVKEMIWFFVSRDRLNYFIHRLETEWNIKPSHEGEVITLCEDNLKILEKHFQSDLKLLDEVTGQNHAFDLQERESRR